MTTLPKNAKDMLEISNRWIKGLSVKTAVAFTIGLIATVSSFVWGVSSVKAQIKENNTIMLYEVKGIKDANTNSKENDAIWRKYIETGMNLMQAQIDEIRRRLDRP